MPNIKQNAINPVVNEPLAQGILAHAGADISADMIVKVLGQFGAHVSVYPASGGPPGPAPVGYNNLYVARHAASTGEYLVILPWKIAVFDQTTIDPLGKAFLGNIQQGTVVYWDPNTDFVTIDQKQIFLWGGDNVLPVGVVTDPGDTSMAPAFRKVGVFMNPSGLLSARGTVVTSFSVTLPAGVTSLAHTIAGYGSLFTVLGTDSVTASVQTDDTEGSIGTLTSATIWPSAPGVHDTVQLRWEAAGVAGDAVISLSVVRFMY